MRTSWESVLSQTGGREGGTGESSYRGGIACGKGHESGYVYAGTLNYVSGHQTGKEKFTGDNAFLSKGKAVRVLFHGYRCGLRQLL